MQGTSADLPPRPPLPKLLIAMLAERHPLAFFRRCRERYGPLFTFPLGAAGKTVMVCDPDLILEVLAGDPDVLPAGRANALLEPLVGPQSTFVLDGAAHDDHRQVLTPMFDGERVSGHREAVMAAARRELDTWQTGQQIVLRERVQRMALDIVMHAVFGVHRREALERWGRELAAFAAQGTNTALLLPRLRVNLGRLSPWGRFLRDRAAIDELFREAVPVRRADPRARSQDDAFSMLVRGHYRDSEPLADDEVRDELLTLLVAAYETVTEGITWAVELLLRDADALERLRQELASGEEAFLEAVVQETLRLRSPLFGAARATAEPVELGERTIPAGVDLGLPFMFLHLSPDRYDDPERFMPGRFLDGQPNPHAWVPFGGGTRRCVGAGFATTAIQVVLGELIRCVRLEPVRSQPERIRVKALSFTQPWHGVPVRIAAKD